MGFFDRFRSSKSLGGATIAPAAAVAPTAEMIRVSQHEPIDIGAWNEQYAPGVRLGSMPGEENFSQAHIRVPRGYELVRSDKDEGLDGGPGSTNSRGGGMLPPTEETSEEPKALYWDPFSLVEQLGFREKPTALTYATLNSMVWRMPIVQAIILTRINQISTFCVPQHHKFETGFRIKLRDLDRSPTKTERKFMSKMEDMILQCGTTDTDPRGRDGLDTFMRKFMRDSLVYDQACLEVVPDRKGRPAEWYAVDAATIRLANSSQLYPNTDIDRIHTVQIYDNVTIAEFTRAEMAFEVRNPRTDIRAHGYGSSELEFLVSTITALLWAWQYNQNAFAQGTLQKGLLNLVGAIPEKQLRAFRRQWYQQISGVENSWRTPITNAEKIEWVNMQSSSKDMEFSAWMDFLIKVACSCYNIDPIEVNFKYGNSGGQKSMFEGASKSKVMESKDKGLKPLMKFFSRTLDKHIIWPINPDFMFEFVGLDSASPKETADVFTQRVRTMYTIDELRAEQDMDPLPDGLGAVILDANWMNAKQAVEAKADQEAAMKKQEDELQGNAAALASMPGMNLKPNEVSGVAQAISNPPSPMQPGMPGAKPGFPPKPGFPAKKPFGGPTSKSLSKSIVIDVEV